MDSALDRGREVPNLSKDCAWLGSVIWTRRCSRHSPQTLTQGKERDLLANSTDKVAFSSVQGAEVSLQQIRVDAHKEANSLPKGHKGLFVRP